MINYKSIQSVHLEISTRCNAACPDCPRNFRGVDIIDDYPLVDMRLEHAQKIFTEPFLKQLRRININGNYGDFVTAQDGVKIVEYFKSINPTSNISISTNASAKPHIWSQLGKLKITVRFRIDGLKDTHALYRQNTDFDLIINNAKEFIAAGGIAVWTMIRFKHNQTQINECQKLSKELGFQKFEIEDHGRNSMPVFDKNKNLTHVIGDYRGNTDFKELYKQYKNNNVDDMHVSNNTISCHAKQHSEIYISATGDVFPCCWLGFYPQYQADKVRNLQLLPMISKNNALDYDVETAIQWFNSIEQSWAKESVSAGKLYVCNQYCGK